MKTITSVVIILIMAWLWIGTAKGCATTRYSAYDNTTPYLFAPLGYSSTNIWGSIAFAVIVLVVGGSIIWFIHKNHENL